MHSNGGEPRGAAPGPSSESSGDTTPEIPPARIRRIGQPLSKFRIEQHQRQGRQRRGSEASEEGVGDIEIELIQRSGAQEAAIVRDGGIGVPPAIRRKRFLQHLDDVGNAARMRGEPGEGQQGVPDRTRIATAPVRATADADFGSRESKAASLELSTRPPQVPKLKIGEDWHCNGGRGVAARSAWGVGESKEMRVTYRGNAGPERSPGPEGVGEGVGAAVEVDEKGKVDKEEEKISLQLPGSVGSNQSAAKNRRASLPLPEDAVTYKKPRAMRRASLPCSVQAPVQKASKRLKQQDSGEDKGCHEAAPIPRVADTSPHRLSTLVKKVGAAAGRVKKEEIDEKVVTINVSGRVFQTKVKTLRSVPGSFLADLVQPDGELLHNECIFLDRNSKAFSAVLNYYRTDQLEKPSSLSNNMWAEELIFYRIRNPLDIHITQHEVRQNRIAAGMPVTEGSLKHRLWLFLEDPASSTLATYHSFFSIFVVLVAVVCFMLQTDPVFRCADDTGWQGYPIEDIASLFLGIEGFVVAYFTAELLCRFWSTTKRRSFLTNIPNLIDVVAILPFYIDKIPSVSGGSGWIVIRIFRLTRIFRIIGMVFKLGKYSSGAKILGGTMISCRREMLILGVVFVMAVIVASSGIFFCENPDISVNESEFESVVVGMYWAVITVTTVGYGDMVPTTSCGQAVSCGAALSGIFCIGLPISVITSKFNESYRALLVEVRLEEERRRFLKARHEISALRGVRALGGEVLEAALGRSTVAKVSKAFGGRRPRITELTESQIESVAKATFNQMDCDKSGAINQDELRFAMKKLGLDLSTAAIGYMMDVIDRDKNGVIDAEEFRNFVDMVVKGDLPSDEDIEIIAMRASAAQVQSRSAAAQ